MVTKRSFSQIRIYKHLRFQFHVDVTKVSFCTIIALATLELMYTKEVASFLRFLTSPHPLYMAPYENIFHKMKGFSYSKAYVNVSHYYNITFILNLSIKVIQSSLA